MSDYKAPDGGPRLLLSAKGMNPDTADDYTCDFCDRRATGYLFMSNQFCDEHNPRRHGAPVAHPEPTGGESA